MKYLCTILLLQISTAPIILVRSEDDRYLITLVYRFIFANEAICGDSFAEPEWLPAAGKCFVNCDPTVHLCMIHSTTNTQKCKMFSRECQAAIRKHLGWSTTIVSVFRPTMTTSPMPSTYPSQSISEIFRGERESQFVQDSNDVDQSAAEAAEDIEQDLMGFESTTSSYYSAPGFSAIGPSAPQIIADVTLRPSTEVTFLESPRIEENGYSYESPSELITETVPPPRNREATSDPSDSMETNYEEIGRNVIASRLVDVDTDAGRRTFEYALPLPPSGEPSPPSFPPFYYTTPPSADYAPTDPSVQENELVPKFINFLEAPGQLSRGGDEDETAHSRREPYKQPMPPLREEETSENEYTAEDHEHFTPSYSLQQKLFNPPDPSTLLRDVNSRRPYDNMHFVPSDTAVALPEGSAVSGYHSRSTSGAARFEIPSIGPLHEAMPMGMVEREMKAISPRVQQFVDPATKRKVVADVEPEHARDLSKRCCEWSLNGLCDRHWQRVRKMCPKSCGSLVCEGKRK
ncbi:hypothetical protein Q1695_000817 [Nippostrongylus brasiliensis]|nr:hypothetical protein Q1695_000817 [Nippostrongylus brasiliensis]